MARQVIWSFEASTDLDDLAEFISKDSLYYAASFVQEILEASCTLSMSFERGRIVPEISNPTIREIFIREYRLLYRIEDTRIVILGLIHGKRDLKRMWEKE